MSETEPPKPLLSVRGVRKTYALGRRAIEVLQGIDLDIEAGAFLALRGASGAGKSTLLHLLGGLDSPTAGTVEFDGQNLSRLSARRLARFRNSRVGFVFQAYHLLPELDAVENVCLPARLARAPAAAAAGRARELLERVGLGHRLDHRPRELSGGEQQRVAIARALINDPVLLLADEPTGNLDSHTGEEIIGLLRRLHAESGMTLLIATHDLHVATCAPKAIDLVDGRIAPDAVA
ncbi:MAG: ABC transporter ATP-binding protein [Verrucomicrobiales bacterium]|nr:ABC transporter ATP-binding protein [Verrucomicrobiales bacterium]